MSVKIQNTENGVRVTDFSLGIIIGGLILICLIIYQFTLLDENWCLPASWKGHSDFFDTTLFQDTIICFFAESILVFLLLTNGVYTSTEFDFTARLVHWRRRSVLGFKARTFPLSSVSNVFLKSEMGSRRERGQRIKMVQLVLCVDNQFLEMMYTHQGYRDKFLTQFQEQVDELRETIWPGGEREHSLDVSTIVENRDPEETFEAYGFREKSPGVYRAIQIQVAAILILISCLWMLFFFLIHILPENWEDLVESLQTGDASQIAFNTLESLFLSFMTLLIIGISLLVFSLGILDRVLFDTHLGEVRIFHLGYFGWTRRKISFQEIVRIQINQSVFDDEIKSDINANSTQVTLVTSENEQIAVNKQQPGVEHEVYCAHLAERLGSLLSVPVERSGSQMSSRLLPRNFFQSGTLLPRFVILLGCCALFFSLDHFADKPAAAPQPSTGNRSLVDEESKSNPPHVIVTEPTFQFGTADPMQRVHPQFELKNTGRGPLKLGRLRGNRPVLPPSADGTIIAPGESSLLEFDYILGPQRGEINNKITLTTNDPENPELTLKITGQVIAKISTEPYPLSIPKTQNEVAVGSVLVKTMKETSFQILETKTSGEHVSVELETIEPGKVYRATVSVKKVAATTKQFSEWVHLQTDDDGQYRKVAFAVKGTFD